ncbi:MAG: LysM peptidoglycan-binding domain-containing protein [Anaerolineales bacterium]|nr:LysM peptidoglycan-binding domain-containing protein [Anaerolineales bacterium]
MQGWRLRIHQGLGLLVFVSLLMPSGRPHAAAVWGTRPLLGYFALTASLEQPLRAGARLSPAEFAVVQKIAQEEWQALRALYRRSEMLISRPGLTLAQKRSLIGALGYNWQVDGIVYRSDQGLRARLSDYAYRRLVGWIERRWPVEAARRGLASGGALAPRRAARTYEIFATRFESKGGAYTVALPDQCLKLSNGGLKTCADQGYQPGGRYSVALSYKKAAGVMVGESGPWNIDDNYWATLGDPTPRRMFVDLPLGMPEAQAAYFNGYNGGLDQYGRKVTAPFGIDLAFQVADDIGLPPKKNDWITVSYLWTAEWDKPPAPVIQATDQAAGTPAPPASPPPTLDLPLIDTVTPGPDGSIVHTVRAGETLWAVALAYGVPIAQLQLLNKMGATIVIYEGQKLLVKEAGPTWTPRAGSGTTEPAATEPSQTATPTPSLTARHTPTATPTAPPTAASETPARAVPQARPPFRLTEGGLLLGALGLASGGALLFGLGWWLNRRSGRGAGEGEGEVKE